MTALAIEQQIDRDGFAVIANVVLLEKVAALQLAVEKAIVEASSSDRSGTHGTRNLLGLVPAVRELAASAEFANIAIPILGRNGFAIRGIWFDKVEGANWKVPWHQDLSVAVRAQRDADGFGPWSRKEGVVHAHAPTALLERMVTLRLHLDDCDVNNAPLRVLPGTHTLGKLTAEQIQELRAEVAEAVCVVPSGGVVVMRPLLLHASSPALVPSRRRVIHLEYAAEYLPGGLEWQYQGNQAYLLKGENS